MAEGFLPTAFGGTYGVRIVVEARIQIQKVANDDIDQHVQVVGVEIFKGCWRGKEEIEKLQKQQLGSKRILSIEKKNEVLSKGTILRAMGR